MEVLEAIKELLKLPFEILNTAQGDSKIGQGLLMILFGSGLVTVIYYILEFLTYTVKTIFKFLSDIFASFTGMFKRKAAVSDSSFPGFEKNNEILIKLSGKEFELVNEKLDEINKEMKKARIKDIL